MSDSSLSLTGIVQSQQSGSSSQVSAIRLRHNDFSALRKAVSSSEASETQTALANLLRDLQQTLSQNEQGNGQETGVQGRHHHGDGNFQVSASSVNGVSGSNAGIAVASMVTVGNATSAMI